MSSLLIRSLPRLVSILAALAIVPWIFGIPGVAGSDYARGWVLGFYALLGYCLAFVVLSLGLLLARRGWLPLRPVLLERAMWVALAVFVVAQGWAWVLILR